MAWSIFALFLLLSPVVTGIVYPSRISEPEGRERAISVALIVAVLYSLIFWLLLPSTLQSLTPAVSHTSAALDRGETAGHQAATRTHSH